LEVIAKEKIQEVMRTEKLTEMQALEKLGVTRLISGTIGPCDKVVRIQARIVKMPKGVNAAVIPGQRKRDEVIALQNDIARQVITELGVAMDAALDKKLFADRTNDTAAAYQMLAESLGDVVPEDGSTRLEWRPGRGILDLFGPTEAFAQGQGDPNAAIRAMLDRYSAALSAEDINELTKLYVEIGDRQRAGLERYFANAKDLKVTISNVDISVDGEQALATFTRTDEFNDAQNGRPMRLEVRISSVLAHDPTGDWRIRGLKSPS
jgi:ketosteroid isomerase-like protein